MEPALPPIHPKVPELLEHLGLKVVDPVKWNVILCRRADGSADGSLLILKFGGDQRKNASIEYEVQILRDFLPQLDQEYFERLVLPEYVSDGKFGGLHWVLTKQIKGRPLLYDWSELSSKPDIIGGKNMSVDIARYSVDILRDLRLVDIDTIPEFVRRFRFEDWHEAFRASREELVGKGIMSQQTVDKAEWLFSALTTSRYQGNMFTNGDFYPRNFILLSRGKIAVADWVGGVDPWEFVAMKAWTMMWGNPAWQEAFIKEIKKHFPVDVEEMQVGLLVKLYDQINAWREEPEEIIGEARGRLLGCFEKCLELAYVQKIFA